MGTTKRLYQAIRDSDLVLVDTSIFGSSNHIARTIYNAKTPSELVPLQRELSECHNIWDLQLRLINRADNVYTIPEVVTELQEFERILSESLKWHQTKLKVKSRVRSKAKTGFRQRQLALSGEAPIYQTPTAMCLLNCLARDTQRTISSIPIYQGPIVRYPADAPLETDFRLVGAAIGYAEANPDRSVTLLSNDHEINDYVRQYVLERVVDTVMKRTGLAAMLSQS
ncbi:hypothetical protein COY27_02000 [Candidatus Woesearchaeota archaeon CG_4_10_14_0_2_um_filter_33_13]|nr:MAG: hypothetical protein COY27_02000 [Candidatus Woesearchaeota archaeon CG_4_10_14_0_2_um_filter_33_13]